MPAQTVNTDDYQGNGSPPDTNHAAVSRLDIWREHLALWSLLTSLNPWIPKSSERQ
jgi:hypothetical protein